MFFFRFVLERETSPTKLTQWGPAGHAGSKDAAPTLSPYTLGYIWSAPFPLKSRPNFHPLILSSRAYPTKIQPASAEAAKWDLGLRCHFPKNTSHHGFLCPLKGHIAEEKDAVFWRCQENSGQCPPPEPGISRILAFFGGGGGAAYSFFPIWEPQTWWLFVGVP